MASIQGERLDRFGIVAAICQEIGLAAYPNALFGPND
jgi:hypothetical protein